jgi:hypothetical protein
MIAEYKGWNPIDESHDVLVTVGVLDMWFKFEGPHEGIWKNFQKHYAKKRVIALARKALAQKGMVVEPSIPQYPFSSAPGRGYHGL